MHLHRRHIRRILLIVCSVLLLFVVAVFSIDLWVQRSTRRQLHDSIAQLPHNKTGLLLGTSKFVTGGWVNRYYTNRIRAAVELFRAGKIDYILVSGDNGASHYNEPETMQADLIAAGVPADRIVLDYAGFRTLDSILRCKAIFSQDRFTIISQRFHNERALAIANWEGLDAVAYNAEDVGGKPANRMWLREKGARSKMMLDLVFNKGPRFYGPKVPIP